MVALSATAEGATQRGASIWRGAFAVGLLAVGAAVIGAGLHILAFDVRRGGMTLAVALLGCGCAAAPLLFPRFGLTRPLKLLAVAVGLMALTAVAMIWYVLRTHPELIRADTTITPLDPRLTTRALPALGAALLHLLLGVLFLPAAPRSDGRSGPV